MKYLTILLTIIAIKSCGSTEQLNIKSKIQDMSLSGIYTITMLDKNNDSHDLTIVFNEAEKKISGFSGCNRYFGSYTLDNEIIKIGPLASTKKYCIGEANNIESKFLEALEKTNTINITENKIQFQNEKVTLLEGTLKSDEEGKNTQDNTGSNYIITYNAFSRGFFRTTEFKNNIVVFQNNRNEEPKTYACTKDDLDNIKKLLDNIPLNAIGKLEAPSKAHQYDGAPGATLIINYKGETYSTNTFDHGNPPEELKELINFILSLTESM
ncbi:MAG: META domain-containing protein [Flavobacteriaceae bacterium]|nr:META domain-containing protein [Bacteroidia bacterium]NNK82002.1 META domain-containing protein [Flavobacteriaceae bacterium]